MVIINPIFMSKLSKIFPEISDQKIEILTFFVYGMSTKDIAYYKGVSVQPYPKTYVNYVKCMLYLLQICLKLSTR